MLNSNQFRVVKGDKDLPVTVSEAIEGSVGDSSWGYSSSERNEDLEARVRTLTSIVAALVEHSNMNSDQLSELLGFRYKIVENED